MNFFLVLLFFISYTVGLAQRKLEQSKEEINKGGERQQRYGESYNESNHQTLGEAYLEQGISAGIAYTIYYGFVGNYGSEIHLSNKLTRYPYERRLSGNYINPDSMSAPKYFRIDVENQFLYSSDELFGNHLKINVRPFHYFYVQGNVVLLNELDDFNNKRSSLHLFNLELCYDRIRFEKFNFGFTLGANYIANEVQQAGFAYGLCAELFVIKSLSFYSCGKLSHINGLPLNQVEIKARYHKKQFYLSAGYEYLKIASPDYHFLSIGGGIYF